MEINRRTALSWLGCGIAATGLAALEVHRAAGQEPPRVARTQPPLRRAPLAVPAADDDSLSALVDYTNTLNQDYGGSYRDIPLEVKAAYYEWLLWRYHLAPYGIVHGIVRLPERRGPLRQHLPESDGSTWNGALLAALSYKYAVTRDGQTLERIKHLLEGLHLFQKATGQPGLPARCVIAGEPPLGTLTKVYTAADGTKYLFESGAAKGTVNQLAQGYGSLRLTAWDDLPLAHQDMAREDAARLAQHLVKHDYRLTDADGKPTPYGDLTPLVATVGVPFNAQVAYAIVAVGRSYRSLDIARKRQIDEAWDYLRGKHHAYYEDPRRHLVRPQQVGASRFVKGMNDRMHVTSAAYMGLCLELAEAQRQRRKADRTFLFELGATMDWSMSYLDDHRNSLVNFMWCGILTQPGAFSAIIRRDPAPTEKQFAHVLNVGVEQLRRFPLLRVALEGEMIETGDAQWVDAFRPDSYYWKSQSHHVWRPKTPAKLQDRLFAAIDFLHAYWLLRYYRLDEHPTLKPQHRQVLSRDSIEPSARLDWPPMQAAEASADVETPDQLRPGEMVDGPIFPGVSDDLPEPDLLRLPD